MRLRSEGLTPRQIEAVLLVTRGLSGREAALRMGVSEGTVKSLVARARETLDCDDTRELTVLLLVAGVIRPDDLVRRPSRRTSR